MSEIDDLPYKAEYAKSSRASCRGCKTGIQKDTLRLAVMVQSPVFDGKMPQWYHMRCFFIKQRPKTVGDISHYDSLRYEDQQEIKTKIDNAADIVVPTKGKKGKKRANEAAGSSNNALKDYTLEYAKSGRAMCRGCEQKILKDEIRISKKDFESDVGKKYGGQDMWHHLECFAKLRTELKYFETGEILPGYQSLSIDDKKKVKQQLPAIKQEDVPEIKKPKLEDEVDGKKNDEIKKQSDIMYKYRDNLKKSVGKKDLQYLLEYNDQIIPPGTETILDRLADIMTFGALVKCEKCGDGQYVYNKNNYVCNGDLSEWVKCQNEQQDPKRVQFKVPKELKEEHGFLNKYKYVPRKRIYNFIPSSGSNLKVKKEDEVDSKPKVERAKPALYNMNFILTGIKGKTKLTKDIKSLGGNVISADGGEKIMAVISTPDHVNTEKGLSQHIKTAKNLDYHVVSEDFVAEAKNYVGKIPELVLKKSICTWGSDPNTRLPVDEPSLKSKSKSKSHFTKSVPKSMTMRIKGGGVIDPDSGLEDEAHVYQDGKDKYTAVLGLTDLQKQKNSFYKLQLLRSDNKQRFWVFRAWGRISTTIGGNKLDNYDNLMDAKKAFCDLYEEKTGNMWQDRDNFVKRPGRMYPIEIDYDQAEEETMKISETDVSSKLVKPVQDLIRMLFDINSMKKVMAEFELDMEKMPLGKLSKKQIQSAFSVLSELQNLVNNAGSNHDFIDASNRFYTFIPHSFGMDNPPLLNTSEIIKEKLDMLDSLMELEIAYSLMKSSHDSKSGSSIDGHYEQLKTEIDILPKDSEEYNLLKDYVKNTHAATHTSYELEIDEVFTVKRQGEEKRFKPFKKLPNRKLLWHGSRTTNFAGILAQGLRIAPPEAPVTGYMFGKGIYFADMVSKSANYCCTSSVNNTGLLLLCDVALGEMYERQSADFIEKLPKGKHSCKGVGMTQPDPAGSVIKNGVEIPMGKAKKVAEQTSLLYNEYIVYDIAQVNAKYLIKMKFKYNY